MCWCLQYVFWNKQAIFFYANTSNNTKLSIHHMIAIIAMLLNFLISDKDLMDQSNFYIFSDCIIL